MTIVTLKKTRAGHLWAPCMGKNGDTPCIAVNGVDQTGKYARVYFEDPKVYDETIGGLPVNSMVSVWGRESTRSFTDKTTGNVVTFPVINDPTPLTVLPSNVGSERYPTWAEAFKTSTTKTEAL